MGTQAAAQPLEAPSRAVEATARIAALDGVRGLAILLVMQFHFWGLPLGLAGKRPTSALDRFAQQLAGAGWSGVDLFFVLSGFLITGILLDARHRRAGYFRNFYARRFLRIFPVYYGFLIFVLVLLPLAPEWVVKVAQVNEVREAQAWYWLYLVNLASGVLAFKVNVPFVTFHFWSLAIEEQFYLFWPLAVLGLSPRRLLRLCLAMVALAPALRIWLVNSTGDIFNVNAAYVLTPARMDLLALGAVVALAVRRELDLGRLVRLAPYAGAAAGIVLAILAIWRGGMSFIDPWIMTVGFSAWGLLWFSFLVITITESAGKRLWCLTHPLLRMFGKYSYCLYVIHPLLGYGLSVWLGRNGWLRNAAEAQFLFNLCFCAVATLASLGIAFLSWHLFEKQFLKLKTRFPYAHGVPAAR